MSNTPDVTATCEELEKLYQEASTELAKSDNTKLLDDIRVQFMGKKGKISILLSRLRDFDIEGKKVVGKTANEVKTKLETEIDKRAQELRMRELNESLKNDQLDASLPGVYHQPNSRHPIHLVMDEAISILEKAGLVPAYGPEIEFENYNFDRLNFKLGHAARDMQATFFVEDPEHELVLRTHTSPVQVRALLSLAEKEKKLPLRIQVPGRVYRVDDDATHSPMFHQIEGLAVDKSSGMGDLRAVLDYFFRNFFDSKTKIRFRPSYFPFTEPSAEVDVSCVFCSGSGCKVCKNSGWIEVAGAGLVHPQVFRECNWNPDEVQGWAFGMGIERLAMLKLGIPDLRSFFENRLSFLRGA